MAVAEAVFRAMASHVQVIVVDGPPEARTSAERLVRQLESMWSRFDPDSDVTRLNHSGGHPTAVAGVTIVLVEKMTEAWQMTGGLYDPTVLPALISSGYTHSIGDPDAATTIPAAAIGYRRRTIGDISIDHEQRVVTVPTGMTLDAGGIGKGLAADLVVAELLGRGAAGVLVSIGGDIAAAGQPPDADGWTIEIEDHLSTSRVSGRLRFTGGGFATSSTRTRRWTLAGTGQHHIIDPITAAPSQSNVVGATVLAPCGWQAEAHATALVLGGSDHVMSYARCQGIEAVATTSEGARLATDGIGRQLTAEVDS